LGTKAVTAEMPQQIHTRSFIFKGGGRGGGKGGCNEGMENNEDSRPRAMRVGDKDMKPASPYLGSGPSDFLLVNLIILPC